MRIPVSGKIVLTLLACTALVGAGAFLEWKLTAIKPAQAQAATSNQFPLLDPSIANDTDEANIINFSSLRTNLLSYLAGLNISHSFYFEYLPDGITIKDDEDSTSEAASLLKTPLVMDLYKLSEQGKISLDDSETVEPVDIDPDPVWGNPTHLKPGDHITLSQAAKLTLGDSDNTTLNVIKNVILPLVDNTSDSFLSLDLDYSVGGLANNQQVTISARSYSSVLSCLYFSCFNTPQDSTQIISEMIGSADSTRLAAGVPANIQIAHKVGSGGSSAQSDCGIVYYPHKPYLVCLMFFNMSPSTNPDPYFQHISQMIYDYVSSVQVSPSPY